MKREVLRKVTNINKRQQTSNMWMTRVLLSKPKQENGTILEFIT